MTAPVPASTCFTETAINGLVEGSLIEGLPSCTAIRIETEDVTRRPAMRLLDAHVASAPFPEKLMYSSCANVI